MGKRGNAVLLICLLYIWHMFKIYIAKVPAVRPAYVFMSSVLSLKSNSFSRWSSKVEKRYQP